MGGRFVRAKRTGAASSKRTPTRLRAGLLQVGSFDALARFDLVVAWNGDGFDFLVIEARNISVARRRFELHRWLWLDHMLLFGVEHRSRVGRREGFR